MVASYKVTCIKRDGSSADPIGAILAIGGREEPGLPSDHRLAEIDPSQTKPAPWSKSVAEVMADISRGASAYYVSVGLRTVGLVIAEDAGRTYLKTAFDAATPTILLDLPDCP